MLCGERRKRGGGRKERARTPRRCLCLPAPPVACARRRPPRDEDDDELTRALRVIRRAGTLVDVLRRGGPAPEPGEDPLEATARRMRRVEEEGGAGGGWLLTSWWEMMRVPQELARQQVARAVSAVVDPAHTPADHLVAREQLQSHPDAETYRHQWRLLDCTMACSPMFYRGSGVEALRQAAREWPAEADERRAFVRRAIASHFGVHGVIVRCLPLTEEDQAGEVAHSTTPPLAHPSRVLGRVPRLARLQVAIRSCSAGPLFQALPPRCSTPSSTPPRRART